MELGRKAAAEVRQRVPGHQDERIADLSRSPGRRLVEAAPAELNKPVFEYSFTPVNLKEINAFALPGGPMFVHRGMFDAAASEGEVVGVMAHELSHVLLRHGTANATKAQGFQLGALAGAIAGAVVGGGWGEVISQGSQFGLGTLAAEVQPRVREAGRSARRADHGARRLRSARSRPHVRDHREAVEGRGGPQWMNSHPNPGNRSAVHRDGSRDAAGRGAARETRNAFQSSRASFAALPPAKSMGELARRDTSGGRRDAPAAGRHARPAGAAAVARSIKHRPRRTPFQVNVPANWQALSSNSAVKFVPAERLRPGERPERSSRTASSSASRAPRRAISARPPTRSTNSLPQGNPDLRRAGDQQAARLSQRTAVATPLANRSPLGGDERISLYTTFLADGNLFYYLTVVARRRSRPLRRRRSTASAGRFA